MLPVFPTSIIKEEEYLQSAFSFSLPLISFSYVKWPSLILCVLGLDFPAVDLVIMIDPPTGKHFQSSTFHLGYLRQMIIKGEYYIPLVLQPFIGDKSCMIC